VNAAVLDLKKAFDRVNHFKLFSTLIDSGVPIPVVNVVSNWYSKLFAAIQWNSSLSYTFSVGSGVRQGRSLSPTLFNLYFSAIMVVKLVASFLAAFCMQMTLLLCRYHSMVCSPCLTFVTCASVCDRLSVKVNNIKSHCIVFGKCCKRNIENMRLGDDSINWVESIKNLGVHSWR